MWKLLTWVVLCGQIVQHVYGVVCELPANCPSKTQKYLTDFGYLDPHRSECTEEDIMAALTKFQELNIGFKGLHVTGGCDNITTFVMDQPRCGCEDIVKGNETKMMKNTIRYVDPLSPQEFRTGNTKWGSRSLTWFVEKYPVKNNHLTRSQVDDAMRRGLQIWADKTKLTFTRAANSRADIVIRFETRRHTTSPPYFDFDGQGNVLAHAFFPESGLVHFDDDEHFVLNSNSGTELYIVAAHEFGHTLGISHSNIKESLMAPYYRYSDNLQLHSDDISAIQSLYGPPDANPVHTTNAPIPTPRPTPPRPSPEVPDYCNIQVQASFRISDTSYIFSREVVSQRRRILKVYTMTSSGISVQGRDIRDVFLKRPGSSYRYRSYPYRVDAATYIPNKQYVLLFQGTKVYGYKQDGNVFYLDVENNYPRWFDTRDFPELPRAAVALPYYGYNSYYVLIFGSTMVWNWDVNKHRVGAWAYPIDAFGRNMPQKVDAAYLQDRNWAIFIKGDKYWKFSVLSRRVLQEDSQLPLKKDLFRGRCM